jgi:hypothetical protein
MRAQQSVAAAALSLSGALCAASCVRAPPPETDAVEATEDTQLQERVGEAAEGVDFFKTIRCTEDQRGADCKEICSKGGIACPAWRLHPEKDDGGRGDLGERRAVLLGRSCWYYYPNGDKCVFTSWGLKLCRYEGGA